MSARQRRATESEYSAGNTDSSESSVGLLSGGGGGGDGFHLPHMHGDAGGDSGLGGDGISAGVHGGGGGGEVILRNGSVAIDVDETTRLFQTMSDEEDGLGLTALRATSSKLPPVSRAGGNRAKSKPYPKELRKTVAALAIMCLNFVLTTASLSVVHEFMPETESLPDIVLDHLPYQEWALWASEITIQLQVGFAIAMIIFHKHRTIVLRRVALMLSLLYGYRAITMMVTVLPKANPKYYCEPKLKTQGQILTFGTVLLRVVKLLSGFGLTMNGKHTYCGDFIFSGHTMTLVLSCLAMREYTSKRLWVLHWFYVLSTFAGVCFLMLGRGHYSIDVLIAYWITTRLWYLIHSMASYAPLKQSSQLNYFSRIWWWRLFRWFECNVRPGPLPHGFNLPVPLWVWACVRKARYCWTKRNSDSISSGGTAGKKNLTSEKEQLKLMCFKNDIAIIHLSN